MTAADVSHTACPRPPKVNEWLNEIHRDSDESACIEGSGDPRSCTLAVDASEFDLAA